MSTDRQRDADLDRLLRAELRREPAEAPGACPDAGLLSACVEGGVSGDERSALEAHLAVCGRCQDVLAAMDLDAPVSPLAAQAPGPASTARRPWLWRGHLHWLIPVGAAAMLVVYVASRPAIAPSRQPGGRVSDEVAALRQTEPPAAALPATAPPAATRAAAKPAPPSAVPTFTASDRARDAAPALAPEVPPQLSKGERTAASGTLAQRTALDIEASKRAAENVAETVAPGAQGIAATETAAKGTALVAAARIQPTSASADRALRTVTSDLIEVSAPGGQIQWRVGPEGAIWRSPDEGRSWYPQKSGVKAALLAAAAPSISTCWAVGVAGTVLLTDDGERWERRPFPEKTDLSAVDARSAHDATVTTGDGRRFVTTDRGATWILLR